MGKVTLLLVELAFILCKIYFSAARIPIALSQSFSPTMISYNVLSVPKFPPMLRAVPLPGAVIFSSWLTLFVLYLIFSESKALQYCSYLSLDAPR